jgi:hypothetical protein
MGDDMLERNWYVQASPVARKHAADCSTACVLGASIICVDIIVRQFPGKKNFKIQDSDAFLSASLSLSFGVMVCPELRAMYNLEILTVISCFQHYTACYRMQRHLSRMAASHPNKQHGLSSAASWAA